MKSRSKKQIIIGIIVIIVVVLGALALFKNGNYDTLVVERGDFVEITEVSGKVVPGQDIDLSFEITGKVSSLSVRTGDVVRAGTVLARLDTSEINSEIGEASANLNSERARLAEISGSDISNQLDSVNESLANTLSKAYIVADDVIRNNVDTFIESPDSSGPDFSVALRDYYTRVDIEDARVVIGDILDDWKETNLGASEVINNLQEVESILFLISSNTDDFEDGANKTQSEIDAYINSISQARTDIATMVIDVNNATEAVRDIEAEVPILQASIDNASASIGTLSAKRNKYVITAPFDGIVTSEDIEVGQVVGANDVVISMIGNQGLEVESFVPEVNIAGVDVGDTARLVFDAFGEEDVISAFVSHVDPRETIKDGVTTYRILLSFREADSRILSGMNVEIEIEKDRLSDQVVIPRYVIERNTEGSYVTIQGDDGELSKMYIGLGRRDNSGNITVQSGLSGGENVVIPK